MKKYIILIAILFAVISVYSQSEQLKKVNVSYIDLSTGKGAISSGFYCTFGINHGNNFGQITMSEESIMINYFFKARKLNLGPSFGSYQNVPYGGAIANWAPAKFFSNFVWAGYSFGEPKGEASLYPSFLFFVNTTSFELKATKLSYSVVCFQKKDPKHVLTLRYSYRIDSRSSIYTDIAYDFTGKTQLLKLGVNIKM